MKLFAILMSLGFLSSAHATVPASCVDKFEIFDGTQVQMLQGRSSCMLTVHPRNAYQTLIYRDFLFDSEGLFMVFNSYGPGEDKDKTGAREYRFFPRKNGDMSYKFDSSTHKLVVTAPSGKVFVFDTVKSLLVSLSGTKISQDYKVNPTNKGGVEIVSNDGLLLDGGFSIGQSPSQDPKDKLTFKDAHGHRCQIANGDVHNYTSDGDVSFKYDDAQLKSFLQNRCPELQF